MIFRGPLGSSAAQRTMQSTSILTRSRLSARQGECSCCIAHEIGFSGRSSLNHSLTIQTAQVNKITSFRNIDILLMRDAFLAYNCRNGSRGYSITTDPDWRKGWIRPSRHEFGDGLMKYTMSLKQNSKSIYIEGNKLFIGDTVMANMAHGLFDHLYRYWLAKQCNLGFDGIITYDVWWEWTKYVARNVLKIPETITYIRPQQLYKVKNLYFASNTIHGALRHPANFGNQDYYKYLRSMFRGFQNENEASPEISSLSDRIFITRPPGSRRAFKNLTEIEDCFRRNGFSVVLMETLSVSDEIMLMKGKKCIAGFFGAGLTNAIAAEDDAEIIEIFSNSGTKTYSLMFDALGNPYRSIDCRSSSDPLHLSVTELMQAIKA